MKIVVADKGSSSKNGGGPGPPRPDLALRSAADRLGLRYQVGVRPVPRLRRTADLVFTRCMVAVFVDGCFWHGCPDHHTKAAANAAYWAEKVRRNRERDVETDRLLQEAGWTVVRVWEHEDATEAASKIAELVREIRDAR